MQIMQSAPGPITVIDGRECLYFAGTGYLGLQSRPEVIQAACAAAERFGMGSATSRTGFVNQPPTLDVEARAARFFGVEASFSFASGYAGMAILAAHLADACDAAFVDEQSHYSVFAGARALEKPIFSFQHRDAGHLAELLKTKLKPGERPLVMSDGLFALLGDLAPVDEYDHVVANYPGAMVALDDAHGMGVIGRDGRGAFDHFDLWDRVNDARGDAKGERSIHAGAKLFVCGTLGKALGGFGGMIPGSQRMIESLRELPIYGGASAIPAPAAGGAARALELATGEPALRACLQANALRLRSRLRGLGLDCDEFPSPIICLKLGARDNMRRIHRELMERGIAIGYFAAYSGSGSEGALRIAVFATHTEAMLDRLADELAAVL